MMPLLICSGCGRERSLSSRSREDGKLTNEHSNNPSARYASNYVIKRQAKLNAFSLSW